MKTGLLAAVAVAALLSVPATGDTRHQEHYRFRRVDPPREFGTPGLDMDVQSLWANDNRVVTVEYQVPRSGVCCGLAPAFFENMHMAVRRGGRWTNIDVDGADTTGGTNPNARGEVALTYRSADGPWHSAIYDLRRGLLNPFPDLPEYPGGILATGLNDRGRIAAYAYDATGSAGHAHGFFGDLEHHEVFDYPDANVTDTFAQMENNAGFGVGGYVLSDGSVHAFVRRHGEFVTIEPPDSVGAIALAINDSGTIVGGYFDAAGGLFGFLLKDGRFTDIRVPHSTLTIPWFIDDRGQISGTYSDSADPLFNGIFHGFVATPVKDRR